MTASKSTAKSTTKPARRGRTAGPAAERPAEPLAPVGGYVLAAGDLEINAGRPVTTIEVTNTGDRPVQVGSHFHFFEVNRLLEFDRDAAFGMRLDIPATTAIRFEPGDRKTVDLVPFGGKQRIYGFNGLVEGWTGAGPEPGYSPDRAAATARAASRGFKTRGARGNGRVR